MSAAATSRYNGCIFCASVHARFASQFSKRQPTCSACLTKADVAIDPRWDAVIAAPSVTKTPIAFGDAEIERLREAGLDDREIVDVINGSAFFNWANRLMLSLGEPAPPATV